MKKAFRIISTGLFNYFISIDTTRKPYKGDAPEVLYNRLDSAIASADKAEIVDRLLIIIQNAGTVSGGENKMRDEIGKESNLVLS